MGRSRRKLNKFRTKVTRKPRRKTSTKSSIPLDLLEGNDTLALKVGSGSTWDDQKKFTMNYKANGIVADPNSRYGRNTANASQQSRDQDGNEGEGIAPHEDSDTDDDLRQGEGKERNDGKRAEIRKLTTHQQSIIKALISSHGEDVEAMEKDRKLNRMLLPRAKLKKMIESYESIGDKGKAQFRAPHKHSR